MLVNMKEMLEDASRNNYAVGGFNCSSLESGLAAIRAAEEMDMPFVLQFAPVHEQYIPVSVAGPLMLQLARAAKTPVAVHLDHGGSVEWCLRALATGQALYGERRVNYAVGVREIGRASCRERVYVLV